MTPIERLERARGGPFRYRIKGQVRELPDPAGINAFQVLALLQQLPLRIVLDMTPRQSDLLIEAWAAHYDLPDFRSSQRLLYLIDRYDAEIEYDLRIIAHEDLGELFRTRRWRHLLTILDRLPTTTYYHEAVANDEEHAELIAKAEAERSTGTPKQSPPLRTWTPEMAQLAKLIDAVRILIYITIKANSEKGQGGKPPDPEPRPETAIDRIRARETYRARLKRHKALAKVLVPHRYKNEAES